MTLQRRNKALASIVAYHNITSMTINIKRRLKKEMEPRIKGQHNSIFYPYKCDSGK
jgi:hypothetical protein